MQTTIVFRTRKKSGLIRLRFRISDGRGRCLYHKSAITADISEVSCLSPSGQLRKGIRKNPPRKLLSQVSEEISLIESIYINYTPKDSETLERMVCDHRSQHSAGSLTPVSSPQVDKSGGTEVHSLTDLLLYYIENILPSEQRKASYRATLGSLRNFLRIKNAADMTVDKFDTAMVLDFNRFLQNEKNYAVSVGADTDGLSDARKHNTVAGKTKQLQTFFSYLVSNDMLAKSPFSRLGKSALKRLTAERYGEPICLRIDELRRVYDLELTEEMAEARDAFMLQCALGCRISDFSRLKMQDVLVSEEGIPYINYCPRKTHGTDSPTGINTPLVDFAYKIVKSRHMDFSFLKTQRGMRRYNKLISEVLKEAGVDRIVTVDSDGELKHSPLWETASSKLARKTHIDLCAKVQINRYATGLHRPGSRAVDHYSRLELKDLYILMTAAFDMTRQ